jgi:hypothetical protein
MTKKGLFPLTMAAFLESLVIYSCKKRDKPIVYKYYLFFLLVFCSCHKHDDQEVLPDLTPDEIAKIDSLTGAYIFPVERSELKLFEMGWNRYYDTCVVPTNILKHLSDDGLIQTCLDYPPYFNIFYFDFYQNGFNRIASECNIFNEIYIRKGIANKLISTYESLEVDSFMSIYYIDKEPFTIRYFEILLAQIQLIDKMSNPEKNQLITDALSKYEYRKTILKEELYSSVLSALILGRILKSIQYKPFLTAVDKDSGLASFLENCSCADGISALQIITYSKEYIKNKGK